MSKKKNLGVPLAKASGRSTASKSSPKKAPGFPPPPSRARAPHVPMAGTCEACRWWRDKGWASESSGYGICDNPKVEVRVTMGADFLVNFCKLDPRDAQAVEQSIRYPNDFGCIFYKRASWVKTVRPLPTRDSDRSGKPAAKRGLGTKSAGRKASPKPTKKKLIP